MTIEKLPSGSYRIRKQIDGKRITLVFDHKPKESEITNALIEKAKSNITLSNAPKQPFYDCACKYIEVKKNVLSASTIRSYRGILKSLGEPFTSLLMSEIDTIAVQKIINDASATKNPKTVKNYYSFITAVLGMFCPDARLRVTLPKPSKTITYIPTTDDVKAVLSVSNEKYYIVFMLGCNGLRRSEILALNYPSDFDLKNYLVHINKSMVHDGQKWIVQPFNKTTESTRDVPLSPDLIKLIKKQGYVYNGHPDKILEYLHHCQDVANVPRFKFHALRHYYATELNQANFSSKDIQKLGGWASDNVLKTVYQHARIDRDKEMQKKASSLITELLK